MHICPLCGKKFRYYQNHLNVCEQNTNNLSCEEFRLLCYKNEGINIDELIDDYKSLMSLPELRTKYKLDFKSICFILNSNNIPIRSMSESQIKITSNKIKQTCLKKYGVENPSQAKEIKDKKAETFKKHYGVDNIWKTKEYAEFTSNRWASYSAEEKNKLLKQWTKSNGTVSKLENRICKLLRELNIDICTQFKFSDYYHKYDIKLQNTKIIFEINGDFWHANPNIYNENDILNFPKTQKNVKDIWKNDKQNIEFALSKHYIVYTIWEDFINHHTDDELKIYLIDIINNLKQNNYGKTEEKH